MATENTILSSPFSRRESLACPLCDAMLHKDNPNLNNLKEIEESITMELRQNYAPHESLGTIIPIIYSILVCPNCYYAFLKKDLKPDNAKVKELLIQSEPRRKEIVKSLFNDIDFGEERSIEHGLLSYLLAIDCYSKREEYNKMHSFKKALCALRASWLSKDIIRFYKNDSFSFIYSILFKKAARYYGIAFTYFRNNKDNIKDKYFIGPDANTDWGYLGLVYITGYLNYRLSNYDNNNDRKIKTLKNVVQIMKIVLDTSNENSIIKNNATEVYNDAVAKLEQG